LKGLSPGDIAKRLPAILISSTASAEERGSTLY
jgi:hypothetical protein